MPQQYGSRAALNLAVRDQLRAAVTADPPGLGLTAQECELAPVEGRPPAMMGERFVGVWSAGRSGRTHSAGFSAYHAVNLTVTVRLNGTVPWDRAGTAIAEKAGGLDDLVDEMIANLAADVVDFRVCKIANHTYLTEKNTPDVAFPIGFSEALQYLGDDPARVVGPDWFLARSDRDNGLSGLVVNVRFGGARRVQSFFNDNPVT